jgi:hypothetical protein
MEYHCLKCKPSHAGRFFKIEGQVYV